MRDSSVNTGNGPTIFLRAHAHIWEDDEITIFDKIGSTGIFLTVLRTDPPARLTDDFWEALLTAIAFDRETVAVDGPFPEPGPHGPVSERTMRKFYGASGFTKGKP